MGNNIIKFCLISTQRSGSTWLIDILDNHPMIKAYEEIFIINPNRIKPSNRKLLPPVRYYRYKKCFWSRPLKTFSYLNFIQNTESQNQFVGFKLMYNQLKAYPEILIQLVLQQYKIIHLVRSNSIDVVISSEFMKKTKIAHKKKTTINFPENRVIYIDPKKLLYKLRRHKINLRRMQYILRCLPLDTLNVFYDELQEDKDICFKDILKFLGIDKKSSSQLHSNFSKVNPGYHWQKIKNYNEIRSCLKGTEFYKLLHLKN